MRARADRDKTYIRPRKPAKPRSIDSLEKRKGRKKDARDEGGGGGVRAIFPYQSAAAPSDLREKREEASPGRGA